MSSLITKLSNLRQRARECREKRAAAQKEMKKDDVGSPKIRTSESKSSKRRDRSKESSEGRVLRQKVKEYVSKNGKSGIDLSDPNVPLEIRLSLTDNFSPCDYEILLQLDNSIDRSASQSSIDKLKKIDFPTTESLPSLNSECLICLCQYTSPVTLCELPCGHMFHHCCAEKWFSEYNSFCPLCKSAI